MGLNYGPLPVLDIKLGAQDVLAVYVGSTRIWPTDIVTGLRYTQADELRVTQDGETRALEGYALPAPQNLVATAVGHDQIDVTWTD